jgi:transcriptional regulator with XRE-family HTH domain
VDDQQFGVRVRAARIRRGWRQADLAAAARVSDSVVSRIERGHLDAMPLRAIRRVAAVLEIRVELQPRSRAADLERLVSGRHSALAESVLAWFATLPGWVARPEVSFNVFGDRGVVDILAWHAATRSLLIIELKTAIVDVGELLATLGRKRRRAMDIAEQFGWRPVAIATWLIVAEGTTNRRRVTEHAATFGAALPARGKAVRTWLASPVGELAALSFVSDRRPGTVRTGFATVRRVSTRARRPSERGRRAVDPRRRSGIVNS